MALPPAYGGVAGFLAVLAVLVILAQPARRLNLLFGAFLLLRAGTTLASGLLRGAEDLSDALLWARVNVWYAIPLHLILIALMADLFFPKRRALRYAAIGVAAGVTLVVALLHATAPGSLVVRAVVLTRGNHGYSASSLLDAYTGALSFLELLFLVLAFRAARSERETALSRHQAALLGIAFAVGPVRNGPFLLALFASAPDAYLNVPFLLRLVPAAVALVVAPALLRASEGPGWRIGAPLVGLSALFGLMDALSVTVPAFRGFLPPTETGLTFTRAAFAGVLALALIRYGLAGTPPEGLRRFERLALGGLAFSIALLGAGVVLALLGLTTASLVVAPLLGVAVLLLSPIPLGPLVSRLSRGILLDPDDPLAEAARLRRERAAVDVTTPPLLGRYRVLEELGRGGTATVYLATDTLKRETVVVKRFHTEAPRGAISEARALAAARSPRVVPLLDVERVGHETFLVLGHVPGGSARDLLGRDGVLPPERAVGLSLDVLEGLAALHAKGIVHGDVKPENVLLGADGRGVLGDLGSARFVNADVTSTGAMGGASLSTVAPEVLRGERPTPASDLYSAAATLYRLLTGRHYVALEGADAFQARERILLDEPRLPDSAVPPNVERALRRALSKRPEQRHPDAASFAADLQGFSVLLVDEQGAAHSEHVSGT